MSPTSNRRDFIRDSASLGLGLAAFTSAAPTDVCAAPPAASEYAFESHWSETPDRIWIGREYWANPLQDWQVRNGRIECTNAAPDRNVHVLTHQLADVNGELEMSVRVGRVEGGELKRGPGSFGFRIGIQGQLPDYRHSLFYGNGIDAGLTADGRLFIASLADAAPQKLDLTLDTVELRLHVKPVGDDYEISLEAYDSQGGLLGSAPARTLGRERMVGNLALVANFGSTLPAGAAKGKKKSRTANEPSPGQGKFWFANWRLHGSKIRGHEEHAFGPILFSHYALSGGILKLTAQFPPLGPSDTPTARLQIATGDSWKTIAEASIHAQARTAAFRVENWQPDKDTRYRIAYSLAAKDGAAQDHFWEGTIRRDPVDQPVITVADISCNIHSAFPNTLYTQHVAQLNPDLLAFVGDQFYESTAGYGVVRSPLDTAIIDYLRKWYVHGWTWRELLRDRPSIVIPDDHDVYQGNIWGERGAARDGTQEMGGYDMHPEWVNVVHRTQTSHHPDPHDATPIRQNISVYYGPLTYGRISFAILADRMFKSGPEGKVPATGGRGDHVRDPNFQPQTADLPGLELLGPRQMKFLEEWVTDWKDADMKAVVSQTIFTAMATTHGGGRDRLVADYDANGWPQTPRNNALRLIRKAFAVHLAGDQHLPAVIQYGIDKHRDAGFAFAGPAVNVGYPRWWEPQEPGKNRHPLSLENTGDFHDHFGNPLTVLAVANGAIQPQGSLLEVTNARASGLGIVRFSKPDRRITIECWPYLADPRKDPQFPGWPVSFPMLENYYAKEPAPALPKLLFGKDGNQVVQVWDERSGELVYALRAPGDSFQPRVFEPGRYTIRVGEPGGRPVREFRGVEATVGNSQELEA